MKNTAVSIALLLVVSFAFAQSPKYRVLGLPVERNTITLRQPWVGGMNSPQFSPIDLNGDNLKDLFVFDRIGDKVLTYINNGTGGASTFDYSPKYEQLFPGFFAWALSRDYNHDGIADIFTHVNSGIGVFKGRMDGGLLRFDTVSNLLLYTDPPYKVNIWTNIADIPVIADVNFDGDMDILTYGVFGAGVEYYENQTQEHPGDPHYVLDSFQFTNQTLCWGNFQQSSISNSIALNVSCKTGGAELPEVGGERHAGNAIFSFDDGNDHDIDLLNGNIGYDNLMFLENGGDSSFANIITWDSVYPACNTHVYMPTYPAAYGVDITNDGLEDLMISPNVGTAGGRDIKNVLWYRNVNNQVCNFEYESDSMLVADMLDFGTDSKPVFFDFNSDGLQDIVIGNYGYFRPFQTYKGTLAYYENIGTATQPRY
ncbi:MAG TPA: VCBS repeat-containing protein, partial [Chitinophagales bacterium]|nr:VCBS repeat-containing protein [Chitinophagales bacterium]